MFEPPEYEDWEERDVALQNCWIVYSIGVVAVLILYIYNI